MFDKVLVPFFFGLSVSDVSRSKKEGKGFVSSSPTCFVVQEQDASVKVFSAVFTSLKGRVALSKEVNSSKPTSSMYPPSLTPVVDPSLVWNLT